MSEFQVENEIYLAFPFVLFLFIFIKYLLIPV
ncbi:protein of unknown function [Citrobacter amalonaticus]|nr:protein of unknown function [Citrobacter amalonaticus]